MSPETDTDFSLWVQLSSNERKESKKKKVSLTREKKWLVVWLVGFYDIAPLVGYLMPNPVYTYIKYMISKYIVCW